MEICIQKLDYAMSNQHLECSLIDLFIQGLKKIIVLLLIGWVFVWRVLYNHHATDCLYCGSAKTITFICSCEFQHRKLFFDVSCERGEFNAVLYVVIHSNNSKLFQMRNCNRSYLYHQCSAIQYLSQLLNKVIPTHFLHCISASCDWRLA